MNGLTFIGYCIYFPATFYITVIVGKHLNKHGIHFLLSLFANLHLAHTFNRFLLMGYYLLNLGYAAITISFWNEVSNGLQLIEELSFRLGFLICGLAMAHYTNLFVFSYFTKKLSNRMEDST